MFKEFKTFIMRGNVIDLAVAVIIGGMFTTFVNSIVKNLISPLIGLFTGRVDFIDLTFTPVGGLTFRYGAVLTDLINFLITGFVVFLVVKTLNRFFASNKAEEIVVKPELEVLTEIRDLLAEQSKK